MTSATSEVSPTSVQQRYRHDPYSIMASKQIVETESLSSGSATPLKASLLTPIDLDTSFEEPRTPGTPLPVGGSFISPMFTPARTPPTPYVPRFAPPSVPQGTLHTHLINKVFFIPFPAEFPQVSANCLDLPSTESTRIFFGQLPRRTCSREFFPWLCEIVANKPIGRVSYITRRYGEATFFRGAVHTNCASVDADDLINALHQKILVDYTGVWVATTDAELDELWGYCTYMKNNLNARVLDFPYMPLVVEYANAPQFGEHLHNHHAGQFRSEGNTRPHQRPSLITPSHVAPAPQVTLISASSLTSTADGAAIKVFPNQ